MGDVDRHLMSIEQGSPMKYKTAALLLLCCIVLLGTAMRLYTLDRDSLWTDEMLSLKRLLLNPLDLWQQRRYPLSYTLMRIFVTFLGDNDFGLRFGAAVAGILCIPAMYKVCTLFYGTQTGLIGSFLVAIAPFHIRYSQEARHHIFSVLFYLLSLFFIYAALTSNRKRWWIGYVVAMVLSAYNLPTNFFILFEESLFAGIVLLYESACCIRARAKAFPQKWRATLGQCLSNPQGAKLSHAVLSTKSMRLVLCLLLICVLIAPQIFRAAGSIVVGENFALVERPKPVKALDLSWPAISYYLADLGAGSGLALKLYMGFFLLGLLLPLRKGQWKQSLILLLWVIVPFIFFSFSRFCHRHLGETRHIIFLLPGYLIGITAGAREISQGLTLGLKRLLPRKWLLWGLEISLAILVLGYVNVPRLADWYGRVDKLSPAIKSAARYLQKNAGPQDTVLLARTNRSFDGDLATLSRYFDPKPQNNSMLTSLEVEKIFTIPLEGKNTWYIVITPSPQEFYRSYLESVRNEFDITYFKNVYILHRPGTECTLEQIVEDVVYLWAPFDDLLKRAVREEADQALLILRALLKKQPYHWPARLELAKLLQHDAEPLPPPARFGVNLNPRYGDITDYEVQRLRLGWYMDWQTQRDGYATNIPIYLQTVRVRADLYPPAWSEVLEALHNNKGATWLIGIWPESNVGDNCSPQEYVSRYREIYRVIKRYDPSAQVAAGGVIQPTPLRLQWLDEVLAEYQARYRKDMPVDAWHIGNYISREERDSWGVGIPVGIDANKGKLYDIHDSVSIELFKEQIMGFRRWMAEHGQRNKPLIISSYGVQMPSDFLGDGDRERGDSLAKSYMTQTFDYLLNERDEELGYPPDDNHLVQMWAWAWLNDTPFDGVSEGTNGALFDWRNPVYPGALTTFGIAFADYMALLP